MKRIILFAVAFLVLSNISFSQITPEISSWILNLNGAKGYSNIPSNVQKVQYSTSNVYVSANCIPGYDIGPWAGNPNTPSNQNFVFKITRNPVKNEGTLLATGLGHIGVWKNGVSIFNAKDAMSYNDQNVWFQNAIVVEGKSFDNCLGHPAPNGEYHHHLNPTCLYNDSLTTLHSPIVGFAFDGFPIYGAYAFADTFGSGGIKRMQSSYRKRSITKRTTLPNGSAASSAGPDVSGTYPLGYFIEDFEYVSGLGDLDEHNGRFCITPEYPKGKYCYFITLDNNLVAEYPYIIGPNYYGTVQAGNTGPGSGHNSISESVTTYNGTQSVQAFDTELEYKVYPNPANSFISVLIGQDMPNNSQVQILNYFGQLIVEIENVQPSVPYSFDLSGLPNGLYFVKINSGSMSLTKKIILSR